MKKITGILLILLTQYYLVAANNVACANFGETCSANGVSDSYMLQETAYGYILNNIDMKTNIDGCSKDGDKLNFCIKNSVGSPQICEQVSLDLGNTVFLGSISNNPEIGGDAFLRDIPLTVELISGNLCLTMPSSRGQLSIICRDYDSTATASAIGNDICRPIASSCYDDNNRSQALMGFSGKTIQCLRETLDKSFYDPNPCQANSETIYLSAIASFPEFQSTMQRIVTAVLILYVMVYGFKLVSNTDHAQLSQVASFVIKFIFVAYFSIGIGTSTLQNGQEVRRNGMTEHALPMLLQITSDFTETVFLAGGSQGLCNFDATRYENGYEFYKVWDAIDCRIGYYLGLQMLYNLSSILDSLTSTITSGITSGQRADFYDNIDAIDEVGEMVGVLAIFPIMFGIFFAGNYLIFIFGIMFSIMFISLAFYFLISYMVYTVTLYVMAYISPIFVPMMLFERTKSYFDAWLGITISSALQPAVIGGFIALLLTMYDSTIYGNCEFQRHDYEISEFRFSTFELHLPPSEPEKCTGSPGYKLMQFFIARGFADRIPSLDFSDVTSWGFSFFYMGTFMFLFYFAVRMINDLAADITGGVSISAVTVSPTKLIDKSIQKIKQAIELAKKVAQAIIKAVILAIKLIKTGGSTISAQEVAGFVKDVKDIGVQQAELTKINDDEALQTSLDQAKDKIGKTADKAADKTLDTISSSGGSTGSGGGS